MNTRKMKVLSLFSLLALVLVMMPAANVRAATPPDVDGRFYGSGEDSVYDLLSSDVVDGITRGATYYYEDSTDLYIAVVVGAQNVNDNVFGWLSDPVDQAYVQTVGWSGSGNQHDAKALINSDRMTMTLQCGTDFWVWTQDYAASPTVNGNNGVQTSGDWYSSAAGPDGSGTPPADVESSSSFVWNMSTSWDVNMGDCPGGPRCDNITRWKSPDGGDTSYPEGWVPPGWPTYDPATEWEWPLVYEMMIPLGENCADPTAWSFWVEGAHNSPPKTLPETVPMDKDWGDLPDEVDGTPTSYCTTLGACTEGGPRHKIVAGAPYLGTRIDAETDGQPSGQAIGDNVTGIDDEEGVVLPYLVADTSICVSVTAMVPATGAYLDAWIDFGDDGAFDDVDYLSNRMVPPVSGSIPLVSGLNVLCFVVPTGVLSTGPTVEYYSRFRISTDGGLGSTGPVDNGEVEDYISYPKPTAVGLASFEARGGNRAITLQWETASEIDNLGFNLYRAESADGPWTQLNADLIPSNVPPGSLAGATYTFKDQDVWGGTVYYYRLESIDVQGQSEFHGPVSSALRALKLRPLRPRLRID
jgi:hypothetical protein